MLFELPLMFHTALSFLICLCLFTALSFLWPNNPNQPLLRKGLVTDVLYWFLGPLFSNILFQWFIVGFAALLIHDVIAAHYFLNNGMGMLSETSLALQLLLVLLLSDLLQYWIHRLFHENPLWKFHAVHHSSMHVDWLSTGRFHPVNYLLYMVVPGVIVFVVGFAPEVYAFIAIFNIFYSPLVHANVRWTYGPLKYFLVSPVFHRWHHTFPKEGGEKNFAPTFAFLDIIFGTFYMPNGRLPEKYGIEEFMPESFIGQIVHPFKMK